MAAGVDLSKTLSGGSEELFDTCCSPCLEDGKSVEADKYCVNCEMYFCKQCLKHHKKFPTTRAHQIVDKSESHKSGSNTDSTQAVLPTEKCVKHNGKLKDMYCGDHEMVYCAACIAVNHRTCVKVDYLPDVSRGIKESQEFQDVKVILHTVHCELKREQTKRKSNLVSLENESKNILEEINHHEDEVISKIRALAQKTRETLNVKRTEVRKTLEKDIKTITSAITTISLNEENISNGNEAEIFANVKCGKLAVKDCKGLLRDLSERSNRKMIRFVANDKLKSHVNQTEWIGTVSILEEEKKEDLKMKADEKTSESLNTGFKEKIEEDKLNAKVRETKKKDPEVLNYIATLSGKYEVNEYHVTAACVLDNKSLMLFDFLNMVLKRLSLNDLRIIDQLKLHDKSFSMCSVGTEEVAVALMWDKKIQIVSVGRTMTLTRSFNTDHLCYGVAFNEVSEEFYVSNNSKKVNVYDMNGKLMKTYDKDGKGKSMFSCTSNAAWSEDKAVLYVTDMKKGLIALSMSGDLLWTFSDTELNTAHGLCVLPGDVILVSGANSNNVIQVDKRGKKIGTLLDAGDTRSKPWALAYDMNRSSLIVGNVANAIHFYNLVKINK